jgi:hypothetical protein
VLRSPCTGRRAVVGYLAVGVAVAIAAPAEAASIRGTSGTSSYSVVPAGLLRPAPVPTLPAGQTTNQNVLPAAATAFGTADTGWSSGTAALSWVSGTGRLARGALAVTANGALSSAGSPTFTVTPGARYTATAWTRAALAGHASSLGLSFFDADGNPIAGASNELGQPTTDQSLRWTATRPVVALAPTGAVTGQVSVVSRDAAVGVVDYVDDVSVTETTGVAAPIVGPLTTRGTNVLDANGMRVQLHGIQLGGLRNADWSVDTVTTSEIAAAQSWGANFARLPLAENPMTPGDCSYDQSYVDNVDRIVDDVTSRGMVILLDLHTNAITPCGDWTRQQRLPDAQGITFWQTVANRYKDNPLVAFDLYNEPHNVTDAQWRNGAVFPLGDGASYTAVGMQQLYDTVRATGATNLVFVSGSGWATWYPSTAPLTGTSNVVYGIHAYTCPTATPSNGGTCKPGPGGLLDPTGVLAAYRTISTTAPVMITEFGYPDRTDGTYIAAAANYATTHGWVGWNVFTFDNTTSSPFDLVRGLGDIWEPSTAGMSVIAGMLGD